MEDNHMYQEWFKKYETLVDDELTKIKKGVV